MLPVVISLCMCNEHPHYSVEKIIYITKPVDLYTDHWILKDDTIFLKKKEVGIGIWSRYTRLILCINKM